MTHILQGHIQSTSGNALIVVENSHMLFLIFSYIASQKITRHVIVATGVASSRHTDSPHFGCWLENNPHIGKWSFFPLIPHFSSFQSLCPFGLFCLLMVLKRFCHPTDPQQGFWHMSRFDHSCCTKQKSLQNILNISFNMFANCI